MAPTIDGQVFQHAAVYPIIDTEVCAARGIHPLDLADACLRGGARVLQIRQKTGGSAALLALTRPIVVRARTHGAIVLVNDRVDIARIGQAAGVHVGQTDLSVDDVRRIAGPDLIVGLSTHDRAQVDAALAGTASYVAVGPVYETATKDTGYMERGLELVRYAAGRGKPIVAIGGITLDRAVELRAAGAAGLAVISDLLSTADPEGRVRAYVRALL